MEAARADWQDQREDAQQMRRRVVPRPLDQRTNGHSPQDHQQGHQHTSADHDLDDSSGDDSDEAESSPERARLQRRRRATPRHVRAKLRDSTPEKLMAWRDAQHLRHLATYIFLFRLINALVTSHTVFAPDEHWQSLEIAHSIVFKGIGWKTWEWQDRRPHKASFWGRHWGDGPIRSILYPALFIPAYMLLRVLHLDDTRLLVLLPSLVQAACATVTDVCTFRLAASILHEPAAWATLMSSMCSAYTFHTTTRTLSNSLEATLTSVALLYWPLSIPKDADADLVGSLPLVDEDRLRKGVALFAACAALRPSNVLFSIPVAVLLVRELAKHVRSAGTALETGFAILIIARTIAGIGLITLATLTVIDSLYYGRLTFTPLAFLKRNVLEGISLFYGVSPLHFYISSALPSIAFTSLPFTIWGWAHAAMGPEVAGFDKTRRRWYGVLGERDPAALQTLALGALAFVLSMSVLGHKETRFLQPIVPILHLLTGYAWVMLPAISMQTFQRLLPQSLRRGSTITGVQFEEAIQGAMHERARQASLAESLSTFTSWQGRQHLLLPDPSLRTHVASIKRVWHGMTLRHGLLAALALLLHLPGLIYLSFHAKGQVQIARDVGKLSRAGQVASVGYLMPCHSTPWQSHMHAPMLQGNASWFITCEPPLNRQDLATYQDESDHFYADPYEFLLEHFSDANSRPSRAPHVRPWPSHLVAFEALLSVHSKSEAQKTVKNILDARGYTCIVSRWNSLFHPDPRRRGRVLLLARRA